MDVRLCAKVILKDHMQGFCVI